MRIIYISVLFLLCCDSNSPTAPSSTPQILVGCGDENACNYMEDCDVCDYNEMVNDLDICGYIIDDCGVCGGDGTSC